MRASDAAGNLSGYSTIATATTPAGPALTLTITAPGAGATVSGNTSFSAVASQNGIGVQFQIDGMNVGPATAAPFVTSIDTRKFANGTHTIAAYVWDYEEGMQLMRVFWDAVVALDASAQALDEGVRFPLCRPDPLRRLFESAGFQNVEVTSIDVPTVFRSFDDYWQPFLGGQGPAPGYVMGVSSEHREALRTAVQQRLPVDAAGQIPLTARAWAARGVVS